MHMSEASIARLREMGTRESSRYATHEELITRYRLLPAGHAHCRAGRDPARGATTAAARLRTETGATSSTAGCIRSSSGATACRCGIQFASPALLVKGERSDRVNDRIVAAIRERAPQVEFAEVAAADHHVTLDNPAGFVQVVRSFLELS